MEVRRGLVLVSAGVGEGVGCCAVCGSRGSVCGSVRGGLVRRTRAAMGCRWVVVWLRGFSGRAKARAWCSGSVGLEGELEAGGVVVVVGSACGRGGGWSGGWEGLVVAFLVGFVICVWFGCGLQGLEVEMRWGGWRCFVVLWRGEGEGEVKGSTLSPRDANPQAASQ